MQSYRGLFEDTRGQEAFSIENDGRNLRTTLRGVTFVGTDFDALSPIPEHAERAPRLFALLQSSLCSCVLEWVMPVPMVDHGRMLEAKLTVRLELGDPTSRGGLTHEHVGLTLEAPSGTLRSAGTSGWFEDELLDLVQKLAIGETLFTCITCAHSDYSPFGHGLFGGLACFRDAKEDYARVHDKSSLFAIWDRHTELVQETHRCPDHRPRKPGTGYRG